MVLICRETLALFLNSVLKVVTKDFLAVKSVNLIMQQVCVLALHGKSGQNSGESSLLVRQCGNYLFHMWFYLKHAHFLSFTRTLELGSNLGS